MKFKARIGTPIQLSKLVTTLEKVADTCVVHLTPEMLQFGVAPDGKDNLQACADLNQVRCSCFLHCIPLDSDYVRSQRTLFLEYMVQSKAENNRISFFVKLENLSRALRSCCSGSDSIQVCSQPPPVAWRHTSLTLT